MLTTEELCNIYNNIQNLYNMDKSSWQEVLAMLYNLVSDVNVKFDVFEERFNLKLGVEVTKAIKEMHSSGKLAEIINKNVFDLLNNKIIFIDNKVNILNDNTATKTELAVERKRINLLSAINNNETEGNSELLDLRISLDGTKFPISGDAIRSQVYNVENMLLNGKKDIFYGGWTTGSISGSGVEVIQATSYMYTKDFHHNNGEELIIESNNNFAVAVIQYNQSEKFVSRSNYTKGKWRIKISQPYYRISFGLTEVGARQVSIEDLSNIKIYNIVKSLPSKEVDNIKNEISLLENDIVNSFLNGEWKKQLKCSWSKGAIDGSGNTNQVISYIHTDFLNGQIGNMIELKTTPPYVVALAQYDKNNKFVSRTSYSQSHLIQLEQPNYRLAFGMADGTTKVSEDDLINLIATLKQKINTSFSVTGMVNNLYNKIVYSFGDSLIAGHYSGDGFLDGLIKECDMKYGKYAINGAEVILNIINQIYNAPTTQPDFIFLDGMTNDAVKDITNTLGELTALDNFTDTFNQATFYGSLEHTFYTLRNKYPDAKIIYVIPHLMPTRPIERQKKLAEAVIKTCKKWSISVVNIQEEGQINTCIQHMRIKYSYDNKGETSGGNGTHLTGVGYDKWYKPMIKAKMLELI